MSVSASHARRSPESQRFFGVGSRVAGIRVVLQVALCGHRGIAGGFGVVALRVFRFADGRLVFGEIDALLLRCVVGQVVLHGQPVAVPHLRLDPSSGGFGDLVVVLPLSGQPVVAGDVGRLRGRPEPVRLHGGELGARHGAFGLEAFLELAPQVRLFHDTLAESLGALPGHHLAPAPGHGHRGLEVLGEQVVHAVGLCAHRYSSIPCSGRWCATSG